MQINLDEGYQFGLGLFETVAVEEGRPVFLEEHLQRLACSKEVLGLSWKVAGCEAKVGEYVCAEAEFAGICMDAGTAQSESEVGYENVDITQRQPCGIGAGEKIIQGKPGGAYEGGNTTQSREGCRYKKQDGRWQEAARMQIAAYLAAHPMEHGVLKIMVSEENVLFTSRKNPYTAKRYEKGFVLDYSEVRRNETSPLTFHKTLNYGDCILEKRKAAASGLDDLLFLNTKGEICETTSANIFFVREGRIYTPKLCCGMLPGVLRAYICRQKCVQEAYIYPAQVDSFEECFVTNSLMGVMPVMRLGKKEFQERKTADRLMGEYRAQILHRNSKKEKRV